MGKIVEVTFNLIVEDDFVEELKGIIDHRMNELVDLESFPEIGSLYYARMKVLGDNNVGTVLASVNEKKEEPETKKISYKEESKKPVNMREILKGNNIDKVVNNLNNKASEVLDNFDGYGYNQNTNVTLDLIGTERYTINFISSIIPVVFDKICKDLSIAIEEDEYLKDIKTMIRNSSDRTITLYRASLLAGISPTLVGNRTTIAGIERSLNKIFKTFDYDLRAKYFIEVDGTFTYSNYKDKGGTDGEES